MRLGKEQAAGYVEDTVGLEDNFTPVEEIKIDASERLPLTPAPEPATVVG